MTPGITYTLDRSQVFVTPIDPGLHPITVIVRSDGASCTHWSTLECFAFVDALGLAHIELENGDVLTWWRWSRAQADAAQAARRARG